MILKAYNFWQQVKNNIWEQIKVGSGLFSSVWMSSKQKPRNEKSWASRTAVKKVLSEIKN